MNTARHIALVVAALAVVGLSGCEDKWKANVPEGVRAVLDDAETFELLSLDPAREARDESKDGFHGWKVLGKTDIKDEETRAKVVAALAKSVRDNDGTVAGCFNPRHGIRATRKGTTAELVICFECDSMQVFAGEGKPSSVLVTSSAQPAFDGVLKAANIPLPKKD